MCSLQHWTEVVALQAVNNKSHSKPWSGSTSCVLNLSSVMMVWREREKLKAGPLSRDFYDGGSCRLELKGMEGQTQHFLPLHPRFMLWSRGCRFSPHPEMGGQTSPGLTLPALLSQKTDTGVGRNRISVY